jgi:hypothetical protein
MVAMIVADGGSKGDITFDEPPSNLFAIAQARIEGDCGEYPAINLFSDRLPLGD